MYIELSEKGVCSLAHFNGAIEAIKRWQAFCGGYVEQVNLIRKPKFAKDDFVLIVSEDARLCDGGVNLMASQMYYDGGFIFGNACLVKRQWDYKKGEYIYTGMSLNDVRKWLNVIHAYDPLMIGGDEYELP